MGKTHGIGILVEETGEIFETMTECADVLGVTVGAVSMAISGKTKLCAGCHLRTVEYHKVVSLTPDILEELYYLMGYECEWREHPSLPNVFVSVTGEIAKYQNGRVIIKEQHFINSGYLVVSVADSYTGTSGSSIRLVHRLVAETYVRNNDPVNKTDVNHIDCDRTNNMCHNLEWCTKSGNMRHASIRGRIKTSRVRVIETDKIYRSFVDCANDIGGTISGIHDCKTGRQKQHRGYHFEFLEDR